MFRGPIQPSVNPAEDSGDHFDAANRHHRQARVGATTGHCDDNRAIRADSPHAWLRLPLAKHVDALEWDISRISGFADFLVNERRGHVRRTSQPAASNIGVATLNFKT